MYNIIILRFGELSTKGKNKITFINKLAQNIQNLIQTQPLVEYDRIFIDYSEIFLKKLNNIFGLSSYSPAIKIKTNIEEIKKNIDKIIKKIPNCKTFKINTKRNDKNFFNSSMEVNVELGNYVNEKFNLKVNLSNPDLKISIEIRKKFSYIYIKKIKGLGGYPVGINGRVLHLISGGFDSPLAAFLLMKKGIEVQYLNFISPPHSDDQNIEKVDQIIKVLNQYQGKSILYRSNFTKIMNYISIVSKQKYKIILMRRSFYRIAFELAKEKKIFYISNGESIGQVASQTLESMSIFNNISSNLILRPLLTFDKQEIIDLSKKINTHDISCKKANETCEIFNPDNPIIKPEIEKVKKLEKELIQLPELELKNLNQDIKIEYFNIKN